MIRVNDFNLEVISASFSQPVLALFTASWCNPCAELEPRLQQLSLKSKHRWVLAEIDAEKHPDLLTYLQIGYLPCGKLYYNGVSMDEFVGALSDDQLRQWFNDILPPDSLMELKKAKEFIAQSNWQAASNILAPLFSKEPQNDEIKTLLAECYIFQKPEQTHEILASVPVHSPYYSRAQVLKAMAQLAQWPNHCQSLPETRAKEIFLLACNQLQQSNFQNSIVHFIEVMRLDMHLYLTEAKKAGQTIFEYLGWQHPLTESQYRSFNNAASRLSKNLHDNWY